MNSFVNYDTCSYFFTHSFWFWESKHHLQIKHLSDQSTRKQSERVLNKSSNRARRGPDSLCLKPNQDRHSFKMWVWSVSLCHDTCCYYGYGLFAAVTRGAFSAPCKRPSSALLYIEYTGPGRIRFRSNISKFQKYRSNPVHPIRQSWIPSARFGCPTYQEKRWTGASARAHLVRGPTQAICTFLHFSDLFQATSLAHSHRRKHNKQTLWNTCRQFGYFDAARADSQSRRINTGHIFFKAVPGG